MPGELGESIPDRRLQDVAQLIPAGPPLDLDQLLALETQQPDHICAPAAPRAIPERHHGGRRTAALEPCRAIGHRSHLAARPLLPAPVVGAFEQPSEADAPQMHP
jgi:hypothetical protein